MKCRKKLIVVEAEYVSDLIKWAALDWAKLPSWVVHAYEKGNIVFGSNFIFVKTLEGDMKAEHNAILIKGVEGELYTCKPEIFNKTYDIL